MRQSSDNFMDEMLKDNIKPTGDTAANFAEILDQRLDAAMKKYTENLETLINPKKDLEIIKEKENEENERKTEGSNEGSDEGTIDSGSDSEC